MNRRDFVRKTALSAAAVGVSSGILNNLAASPYGKPVGIQLYTVRGDLEKDVPGTIKKVAEIGYKEVEVYALYGMTVKAFSKLLADNGLVAPSGHYMVKDIKENWQQSVEQAHGLGLKYMVNAILQPEERKSFDDYKRLVDLFNNAAIPVQKAGMTYCYHNHNFEFQKYGDTTAYDYLQKNLDPKIKFELDCFWVIHAGHDPVEIFKAHPGRFPLLHIKDIKKGLAPTTNFDPLMGHFVEVGQGQIDWKRIFKAAPIAGMKHYYYEQDECERPALESAKMSYDYLSKLTV